MLTLDCSICGCLSYFYVQIELRRRWPARCSVCSHLEYVDSALLPSFFFDYLIVGKEEWERRKDAGESMLLRGDYV